MRNRFSLLVGIVAFIALTGTAFGAAFTVGATDNVFLAGQSAPAGVGLAVGSGTLPFEVSVMSGQTLGFSNVIISSYPQYLACNVAKLTVTSYQVTSPDGGTCGTAGLTDISSYGGISGITAPSTMFLAGVFLGGTIPGTAPATLDFTTIGTNFTSLAPQIGQVFFIGDGMTGNGTGMQQHFVVPTGATTLYLGFADGNDGIAFIGANSHYGDNFGSVNGDVMNIVPEPASMALMGLGLVGLSLLRRRRK